MSDELNNGVNWTQVNNPSIWGSSTDPLWRVRIADSTNALSVARCAAEESITIIQAHRAEIERLTAALATAEAERDAAYAVAKVLVKSEGSINVGGTKIARTGAGYLVSNLSGSGSYGEHQFDAAWSSFVRNAAPQPAAAPAVDAAPVESDTADVEAMPWDDISDFLRYAANARDNAKIHIGHINDNRTAGALEQYGYAIHNIIEALKHMQKGETQS